MILFIEPVSKNIGMYVPAYPLPAMEIASFVKSRRRDLDIGIISIPMDYGLPLTQNGKEQVYRELLRDLSELRPKGVGISCTAIAQAEETIRLCELIKGIDPEIFVFLGGYFPTVYYEEILARTSAVDLIVRGEGEVPSLRVIDSLEEGGDPREEDIPGLAWKRGGEAFLNENGKRFDLREKAPLDLDLLRHPGAYDILPYAFSRGCSFRCNFCMEAFIRPARKEVPFEIIRKDLTGLSEKSNCHTLLISDALFKSYDLIPFIRSLGMKVNFETRADVLDPTDIRDLADICGALALGLESASYDTLRRMNKVRDRAHYERYISNARAIFEQGARYEIPMMVFMIAGYPGDTEEDLEETLHFARELAGRSGAGGHVFKIGECRAYPKTKLYDTALATPGVAFDDEGVFGDNIVRQPSRNLNFETVLDYMREIFNLSNNTEKSRETLLNLMPFFRLPPDALRDAAVPDSCLRGAHRDIFNVHGESLAAFKAQVPRLAEKYMEGMYAQRSKRTLDI